MRTTYHLRSELFPYIYTSVRQCYDQTLPLLRPMYLAYPNQEAAYSTPGQYQYGDNLFAHRFAGRRAKFRGAATGVVS